MNPSTARPPSRFMRGRARGGGSYRPYFFFRRNGQVIPAGGQNHGEDGGYAPNAFRRRGRGGRKRGAAAGQRDNSMMDTSAALDSTFLRPEHYAAPEDALQVQSIAVDSPVQCPGWRLYFNKETYLESSDLSKRIKLLEEHYSNNLLHYDLADIQRKCYFVLQAKVLATDATIEEAWPTLHQDLQVHPQRTLATFGVAMHSLVTLAAIDASLSQQTCSKSLYVPRYMLPRKIYVRPVGFMKVAVVAHISNSCLDTLVCVRGAVAAIGSVDAAAAWIAYKCTRCNHEQAMRQSGYHVSCPYSCKRDGCLAKKGFVEQRSSPHTRIVPKQIIRLAENHLQALTDFNADLPEFLDIELRHDLVDSIFSGQDIIVTGVLKRRPLVGGSEQQHSFNAKSNSIEIFLKALSIVDAKRVPNSFTERDKEAISMINGEPDSFKLLVHSLAPELHGQELAKAGVLLSLFGGAGSQLHDEAELHVLLVGDPGIGKSHMLEMCAKLSEKGSLLSSKRSTIAGNSLTASIQGRGNYSINSGAVITSFNGHCSIDDIDRVASQQETLLQVMQSQIISLPFTSVFATLTTPTAIIATANSMRGHYDQSKLLKENIRIHPALLSEFHLVFLLLDKPNKDLDTSLTEHIKALHAGTKKSAIIAAKFAMKPKTNNSMNITLNDGSEKDDENYDLARRLKLKVTEEEELDLLPPILVKKFIAYARQEVKPLLTAEAAEALKAFYMELRKQKSEEKFCSLGTSQLEALIRLTQARARIDFSNEATKLHARDVLCIVRQSIADTAVGDYVDINPATTSASATGMGGKVKRFVQMLQLRSNALGRRIFDFDELKEMASRAGIACGVTNLVDIVNLQGFLLKKGPNLYEVMAD